MEREQSATLAHQPGLVWGYDFSDGEARPVTVEALLSAPLPDGAFRWLHFDLADQRTQRWLGATHALPRAVCEMLTSVDPHQRYVIEGETLAMVLHDVEQAFDDDGEAVVGALRFAVGPHLMVTGRRRPVRAAEWLRRRLHGGARPADPAAAVELLFAAVSEVQRAVVTELDDTVQKMEDDLIANRPPPDARTFLGTRSLMVRLHRALSGMRSVLHRLEEDGAPAPIHTPAVRFSHRVAAMDAELLTIQSQLRLLREEVDLQAAQRTNQTLNTLSILSALLMPATLVTGIFGMNTGGFPWAQHPAGTLLATLLAGGASGAVYLVLRFSGRLNR